ncbi:MAG: hypothetical protein COT26_00240 [Candidatus Kerfeldbacteria bacterium CG08_land_8_20_14_0_20_43_14]|uniref:Uncharacterized protein n=1 Tax=Candidatus Kerfeldbacteria bacterium CG08_land_8_20_14_0_20_43_14 TaxID=2014246 RepID=A0A2H0YR92_9BACT|nr:MAG: hypothetical protein COT26_00240 [Candidatus Kerfeldbacteria bacterium CG08_land_8_20_14_0_20_43_14]
MENPENSIENQWFDPEREYDEKFNLEAGNVEIGYRTDEKGNIVEITKLKILKHGGTLGSVENDKVVADLIANLGLKNEELDASGGDFEASVFDYSHEELNTPDAIAKIKEVFHADRPSPVDAEKLSGIEK